MSDLIDRQKALKHIEKIRQRAQMLDDTYRAGIIITGMNLCEKAVMDQPSVQSEIVHCRDCKFHNEEINQCNAQICASMCDDDFCSKGKRREE